MDLSKGLQFELSETVKKSGIPHFFNEPSPPFYSKYHVPPFFQFWETSSRAFNKESFDYQTEIKICAV